MEMLDAGALCAPIMAEELDESVEVEAEDDFDDVELFAVDVCDAFIDKPNKQPKSVRAKFL